MHVPINNGTITCRLRNAPQAVISLKAGVYYLEKALELGALDSGLTIEGDTSQGQVVLSAGQPLNLKVLLLEDLRACALVCVCLFLTYVMSRWFCDHTVAKLHGQ
jgi:hypothetical protein